MLQRREVYHKQDMMHQDWQQKGDLLWHELITPCGKLQSLAWWVPPRRLVGGRGGWMYLLGQGPLSSGSFSFSAWLLVPGRLWWSPTFSWSSLSGALLAEASPPCRARSLPLRVPPISCSKATYNVISCGTLFALTGQRFAGILGAGGWFFNSKKCALVWAMEGRFGTR